MRRSAGWPGRRRRAGWLSALAALLPALSVVAFDAAAQIAPPERLGVLKFVVGEPRVQDAAA